MNKTDLKKLSADEDVLDEAATDETVPRIHYDITSFGADYDVDGLVRRLGKAEIFAPPFQRGYVWNIKQASRFIESLLLGLPVPGVFLAKERDTNKFLVIDGQQRLKTLKFFFDGVFNPQEGEDKQKPFKLLDVQEPFEGKGYAGLEENDRLRLENSIIHATIVKQDAPPGNTSIYHIFERLNTGGLKLTPQEVRTAAWYGGLILLLRKLNKNSAWRKVFGKPSVRLKDQELILRFLAFFSEGDRYEKPVNEFLNKFVSRHRDPPPKFLGECEEWFSTMIKTASDALGKKAFRPAGSLNAAVFDSVSVSIAKRLAKGKIRSPAKLEAAYKRLLANKNYQAATQSATSDEINVKARMREACKAFNDVE